ncbi:MAG TPA: hypothetical protein VFI02_15995 [Armatimonadota bacterium]|nr:hypothetical protein [Armatimonadota bacterium]
MPIGKMGLGGELFYMAAPRLDKNEVRKWLEGQKAAEREIARERARYLRNLTPEESWRIYLSLKEISPDDPHAGPSPMLMAVRKVLKKYAESKEKSL